MSKKKIGGRGEMNEGDLGLGIIMARSLSSAESLTERDTNKEPVTAHHARTTPALPRYLADITIGCSLTSGAAFQGWEWPDRRFIHYVGVDQSGEETLLLLLVITTTQRD